MGKPVRTGDGPQIRKIMSENGTTEVGWFDALGESVPAEQRQAAGEEARKMGVDVPDDYRRSPWVNEVARLVERDKPKEAIKTVRIHLDLTGTYRFLAALCVPTDEGN